MDLFDYCNYESDSFPDSVPQILGSSGPHALRSVYYVAKRSFVLKIN